jgi:hypothetical protein
MGEVGEDGWQFFTLVPDLDVEKIAQSEQLISETIASMIDKDITFNKVVWASDYRYLSVSFLFVKVNSNRSFSGPIFVW